MGGKFLIWGLILAGLWTTGCDNFIESQVFFPDRVLEGNPAQYGLTYEEIWITTQDGQRLHAWWTPGRLGSATLLFCHGNAGNISHRIDNISRLHALDLSVLIFDYRGYGKSTGSISEKGFYLDAEAALIKARDLAEKTGGPLVVFGRSLGGIAAVHIGSRPKVDGLILESTFTHLGAMASSIFPLPGMESWLKERFNAEKKIGSITCPILFFHGDEDGIVPFALGRALFTAAMAPKEFVTLKGAGHNDTYYVGGKPYFDKIKSFVQNLSRAAPGALNR